MDILVASTSGLLQTVLLWTLHKQTYIFICAEQAPKSGIVYGNSVLNILKHWQTVFQSGYTILHSLAMRESLVLYFWPTEMKRASSGSLKAKTWLLITSDSTRVVLEECADVMFNE